MDIDLDFSSIASVTANNAKPTTKFQPKSKPKPKPKPKPQTQPEPVPKSTPTPSTQFVEAATTANNEQISRTEDKQPKNDDNQISGNKNDNSESSFEKSQGLTQNAESFITLDSVNDFLPESTTETGTPTVDVSMDGNLENGPTESGLINNIDACTNLDPLTGDQNVILIDNEDFHTGNLSTGQTGPKVIKFKPKPKAQTRKMEQVTNNNSYQDEISVQYEENIHSIPSQNNITDEIFGSSSIKLTDSIPTETISDYHLNEESIDLTELTENVDSAVKSSERLKKKSNKSHQLVDEPDDENIDNDFVNGKEHNNNDGDNVPDNEILSVKKGNKSKKTVNDKEKPVRKRKKKNEVEGESAKVAKKKFSHSTRRPKRQVNPDLLKIPEDELELHNVPMKELIRLAEHRERLAKKEASTLGLGTPAVNQSSGFSDLNDEYEGIAQGTNSHNDYSMEAQNTTYYNYGTYMKIKPRMKWSKQDTELFYEALQQFGTDLSLIKECFPGRTREQIKSKYKKEERQQPLRLNDALANRAKGLSHFEVVIERLKQAQAEEEVVEEEDYENDDQFNFIGEKGLPTHDINETTDATKSNQLEKEFKDDVSAKSPIKSDDSEDDMLPWDQYNSEI